MAIDTCRQLLIGDPRFLVCAYELFLLAIMAVRAGVLDIIRGVARITLGWLACITHPMV
jgi:hypothetical protein